MRFGLTTMKTTLQSARRSKDPIERMVRFGYGFAASLAIIVLSIGLIKGPVPQRESYFSFYAESFFREFDGWTIYAAAILSLGAAAYSLRRRYMNAEREADLIDKSLFTLLRERADMWLRKSYETLRMVLPIVLNLFLLSYVVGYVNAINQHRLIDARLAELGYSLTGTYPFLSLEMIRFPGWLIKAVELSFLNLPFLLVISALLAFFSNKKIFSKYVVAFFLTFAIMTPVWLLVPAMSPQDRFIDNVYHLKDPPAITSALEKYRPVPQVESFLKHMRKSKLGLEVMPTTTFPSSHAAWATLAAIYLIEISPLAAALIGPFLILSTLGTFYLAQHYVVDTLAGIIIGAMAAAAASVFFGEKRLDVSILSRIRRRGGEE